MIDGLIEPASTALTAFACKTPRGWPIPPQPLWESTVGFISVFLGLVFATGASSRSLAVGSIGAYTMFVHFGVLLDNTLLTQVMYVALVMTVIGVGFKLWKVEGPGGGGT
jgi:hypothetical protein